MFSEFRFHNKLFHLRAVLLLSSVVALSAQNIYVKEFPLPAGTRAGLMVAGLDGALWFTTDQAKVGRMTTTGEVTFYPFAFGVSDMAAGPDGALWFTCQYPYAIVRMSTTGAVTSYTVDQPPGAIVADSYGLHFTAWKNLGYVDVGPPVRIDLDHGLDMMSGYFSSLAVGPYGVYTSRTREGLGARIMHGSYWVYDVNAYIGRLTAGPDGTLWFPYSSWNRIGRLTPTSIYNMYQYQLTTFPTPTQPSYRMVAGPDGALWFFMSGNWLGRMTTSGELTQYAMPMSSGNLTLGPDRNLWIAGYGEKIAKIVFDSTPPLISPEITGTMGGNGWYTTDVKVKWSVTDPESDIASSSGCGDAWLNADSPGNTLTCTATNGAGLSQSASATVKIDRTAPLISGMPAPNVILWPPNNKLVTVATITAHDALSGLAPGSLRVTANSNEPAAEADTLVSPDGTGGFVVQLRATRSGDGTGRIYTITASAEDVAGNKITLAEPVLVPHDEGK